MKTFDDHFGVFATAALTATAVGYVGDDQTADGAYIVADAVALYVVWASFIRPRLTRPTPDATTN
ncbi:MAG: hypothetical protein NTV28_03170 [Propionibacteriales bacterium]|nr:hypothetical protein [Propionibacteriales bacterium]